MVIDQTKTVHESWFLEFWTVRFMNYRDLLRPKFPFWIVWMDVASRYFREINFSNPWDLDTLWYILKSSQNTQLPPVHLSGLKKCSKEKSTFGSAKVWGAIFTLHFDKTVGRKLRRLILLHEELVTFNFHSPANPKTHHLHVCRT